MFSFIHTSDWHLGKPFGQFEEDLRGRLREARHSIIERMASLAHDRNARLVLVAGDVWDSREPSAAILRQSLNAMAGHEPLQWALLPGNHDLAREGGMWERLASGADRPGNVHLLLSEQPFEVEDGVFLLPAPCRVKDPGRDLTAWMDGEETPKGAIRIGVAHGSIQDFSSERPHSSMINPNRVETGNLDYLALGDWHGTVKVGDRCWYSGTPEPDRFRKNQSGNCLLVQIEAAGEKPFVESIKTRQFAWADSDIEILPRPVAGRTTARLPARRNRAAGYAAKVAADRPGDAGGTGALGPRAGRSEPVAGISGPRFLQCGNPVRGGGSRPDRPGRRLAGRSGSAARRGVRSRLDGSPAGSCARCAQSPVFLVHGRGVGRVKLRALRMANVRRFGSEGVVIEGIADGLNVFAAPNEAGKSTLFDALHALLFVKYTSKARPVSSLKPYAGGWPRIAADVEFDGASYRVEKQFLGGPFARVVDLGTGQEIARADEAQEWIDRMIGADGETGGPTGLLWVRQGESSNLDQGTNVRAEALENVIEGEVTTLTGGERARRVMERCTGDLDGMVTRTDKPKVNGAYDQSVREVERLTGKQTELQAQLDKARDALEERHAKQLLLDELTDPDREKEEDERLSGARSAKEAAERHQENIARAETQLDLARLATATAEGTRDTFAENCREARKCREQLDELKALLPKRSEAAQAAGEEHDQLREAAKEAGEARQAAKELLGTARSVEDARRAKQRHGELSEHLTKAEEAERDARGKRASAEALGVEQGDIRELDRLSRNVEKAEIALHAVSTWLQMSYEPGCSMRARIGTQVLDEGLEVRLDQPAAVAIDGVGSLSVTPGSSDSGTDARRRVGAARDALAEKLEQLNCKTVEQARGAPGRAHESTKGSGTRRIHCAGPRASRDRGAAHRRNEAERQIGCRHRRRHSGCCNSPAGP